MLQRLLVRLALMAATLAVVGVFALFNEWSTGRVTAARGAAVQAVARACATGLATPLDEPGLVAGLEESSRAWGALADLAPETELRSKHDVDALLETLRVPADDPARALALLEALSPEEPALCDLASRLRELRRGAVAGRARAAFWERVARKPTPQDLRVLALVEARTRAPDAPVSARLAGLRSTTLFLTIPDVGGGTGDLEPDDWQRFALATGHAPTLERARLVLEATSQRTVLAHSYYGDASGDREYLERWRFEASVRIRDGQREVWKTELQVEDPPLPDEQVFFHGTHGYHQTRALLRDALLAKASELGEVLAVTEADDEAARELAELLASE